MNSPSPSGLVVGIDVGRTGAIALLTAAGDLVAVDDMPCLDDGPKGRPAVNGPLLAALLRRLQPIKAYVEGVNARQGEAPSSAFNFGRSRGVVEGVLAALEIPATMVAPVSWKKAVGLRTGQDAPKDAARAEACRRWPNKAGLFARVKDDGRADAALIGLGGLVRTGQSR